MDFLIDKWRKICYNIYKERKYFENRRVFVITTRTLCVRKGLVMGAYFFPLVHAEKTGQCGAVLGKNCGPRALKFLEENFEGNVHYGALLTYLHNNPCQVGYVCDYEVDEDFDNECFGKEACLAIGLNREIEVEVDKEHFVEPHPYWLINTTKQQKALINVFGTNDLWRIGALALLTRRATDKMGGGDLPDHIFNGDFTDQLHFAGIFPMGYTFNPQIIGSWYGDVILTVLDDKTKYTDYQDITKQVLLMEHFN